MIQVPDEVKTLFKQDSVRKNFRVHFPNGEFRDLVNSDIVSESVVFTESISSADGLKFGLCEGAHLEFDTYFNQNIRNLQIYAEIEIDTSSLNVFQKELTPGLSYETDLQSNQELEVKIESGVFTYYDFGVSVIFTDDTSDSFEMESYTSRDMTITWEELGFYFEKPIKTARISIALIDGSNMEIYKKTIIEGEMTSEDVSYPYYPVPYGYFYVDSCKKDCATNVRKVVAYQNKYNNDLLTGELLNLSPFEQLKMGSTASTESMNYNYPLALCSMFNDPELLDELELEYTESSDFVLTGVDPLQGTTYTVNFSESNGGQSMQEERILYRSPTVAGSYTTITLYLYDKTFAFGGVFQLNDYCPGYYLAGARSDGLSIGLPMIFAAPSDDELYQFSIDYGDTSLSELVSTYTALFKSWSRSDNNNMGTIYVCPTINPLGQCSSGTLIKDDVISTPSTNPVSGGGNIPRIVPCETNSTKPTFTLYPYTMGVTDYTGNSNHKVADNKLGCIGYKISIPYRIRVVATETRGATSSTTVLHDSTFLDVTNANTITARVFKVNSPINPYVHKRIKHKARGYNRSNSQVVNGNVYDAVHLISGSDVGDDPLNLKSALEGLIELTGKFGRFDRQKNILELVELKNEDVLYPNTELYPSANLYPIGVNHFISRSLWKSVWYDDLLSNKYRRIIATWIDKTTEEETNYIYTIVPDEDIVNPNDYQNYDLSSNFFITNGLLTSETVAIFLDRLGEYIKNIRYYVSDIEMRALPYMEAGDEVVVSTADGGFSTFCLRHRISGIHALMDNIEAR